VIAFLALKAASCGASGAMLSSSLAAGLTSASAEIIAFFTG